MSEQNRASGNGKTIALMLESDGPGGAEIFLLNSAVELRRRGYRVLPFLPSNREGWLGERFREHDFEPMTFAIERALDWQALRDLVIDLDREGVDFIHSHEFAMAVYGTVSGRILGKPHVITMHGNMWVMDARRRRVSLKWAFGASRAVVAVSKDTHQHLVSSLAMPAGAIHTIPNGIPTPQGDPSGPRAEFGISEDDVVFLAAGNLRERKGHIFLLRALNEVMERGCTVPWRVIIAGQGPEHDRLETYAREHGIGDRVHLPGFRGDIPDLQAAAHVLVMPSIWEGLPLAILEGMFAGNAIVASNISGIPEAVRHDVDGILTEPKDVGQLADALQRLLENPDVRERMGASALARARHSFSIERMMDDYEALYHGRPIEAGSA